MLVPGSPTTRWTVVPNGASTTGAKYPGFDTLGSVNTRPASVTMVPLLAITVTAALPLCPSLVAVMLAEPAAPPVTSPLPLTVATAGLLLAHITVRPVSELPAASFGMAVSWAVPPTTMLAVAGDTATDATATCTTVTVDVPLCPSLVAVIVAVPATLPVTRPLVLTVATAALPLAHATARPVSTLPAASLGVATSCTVLPSFTLAGAGVTVTDATGPCPTVKAAVPVCPSLVAVIVADPAVTPVTSPLPFTVARLVLLLIHITVRPVNTLPAASFRVAVSCTVLPASTVEIGRASCRERSVDLGGRRILKKKKMKTV